MSARTIGYILLYLVIYAAFAALGFYVIGTIPSVSSNIDNYVKAAAALIAAITGIMSGSLSLFLVNTQLKNAEFARYEKLLMAARRSYGNLQSLSNGRFNENAVEEADEEMNNISGSVYLLPGKFQKEWKLFVHEARVTKELVQQAKNENSPLDESQQIALWKEREPILLGFINTMRAAIPKR